jgi:hypothetical protein
MAKDGSSESDIRQRVKPILDNVAVDGLRAWLRAIEFKLPATVISRAAITDHIVKLIAEKQLAEAALETALIGFEEASDMRIYLFRLEDEVKAARDSLAARLTQFGIPITSERKFAGEKVKPMSPIYGQIENNLLRVKWAEQQTMVKVNPQGNGVVQHPVPKRAVLIADFGGNTAELRLNPPENVHSYEDASGHPGAEEYYKSYLQKAHDILGCHAEALELRPVIRNLVKKENPRIVRIHIDNHTNQKNFKMKTSGPRADIRDDPDWQLAYKENGETWAWDAQSFYWLPKVSTGFLTREVFTHIDAEEGFAKVNADCSNDEVEYVVSQIRAY